MAPFYPGLEQEYDREHRARSIENGEVETKNCSLHLQVVGPIFLVGNKILMQLAYRLQVLGPMRFRGHDASFMSYDVRYEEYFERAGLLGFVCQFRRTPPTMNHTALTALVDRWRPETHSFHLPCGEMTITLEDFAMITALPIDGTAVTGRVDSDGWRERVEGLIGDCPDPPAEGVKDTRPAGVPYAWIRQRYMQCPENAEPEEIEQYARAYLWHLLTMVLFPDASGDTASWMYLDVLGDFDAKYSWGSAGLAFLYRQVTTYFASILVL